MSVWFITGAGRGMGLHMAKAALAAGHQVVATGRNTAKVSEAFTASDNLLVVKLDVTSADDAAAAAKATIDRFGRIDVLVNNAASFYAGLSKSCRRVDGPATGNQFDRPDERHPRIPACNAPAKAQERSFRSRPQPGWSATSSAPPTRHRSLASMAGWRPCRQR